MGNLSIGCACINLSFRTYDAVSVSFTFANSFLRIAVWAQSKIITIVILLVGIGHWVLLFHSLVIHARWVDGAGCVLENANTKSLTALFIYTMCFDFIVLCLTGFKLTASSRHAGASGLTRLIFTDGLIYFFVA